MRLDELLEILNTLVPEPEELAFDKIGVINEPRGDIKKIGVCVDVTEHVLERAYFEGIDFLVVHHGHGAEIRKCLKNARIGGYGIHLALDTREGGLIDSFAHIFSEQYKLVAPTIDALDPRSHDGAAVKAGEHKPIDIVYHGIPLKRIAVRIQNSIPCGTYGYGIPAVMERTVFDTEKVFTLKYREQLPDRQFRVKSFHRGYSGRIYNEDKYLTAIVTTGTVKGIFLEKLHKLGVPERLLIVGGIEECALGYAEQFKISVIAVGNFESHLPGMVRFTHQLGGLVAQRYGNDIETIFIPNYPFKK